MLLHIRKKASGWVAWIIVILISIPFAFWGINSYFDGANEIKVANVDGDSITQQAYQNSLQNQRRFMQQQFGEQFDPAMTDSTQFRQQVLEGLVSQQLIQNYVRDQGLRISDDALSQRILKNTAFQEEGQFSEAAYRRILASSGYSPEGWEARERINGAIGQLRTGLANTAFSVETEVEQILALSLQQRDAEYTVIAAKPLEEGVSVEDSEIQAEYDANMDNYQQGARIKADYIELSVDQVAADLPDLTEEEITAAYERTKGQHMRPEARKASHILFRLANNAPEEQQAEVTAKAEAALARANAGEDFAVLAEELSEDPGSGSKGGDLGLVTKGQMVPPFEEAVFDMVADEIRGLVKTDFGLHIIKLTELTPERQLMLSDVREEIISAEKRRSAADQFGEVIETLRNLVFESPESLQQASETLGLDIKTSDWFERNLGAGVADNPLVRAAAFSDAVLQEGINSEVVELEKDTVIALSRNEFEESRAKSLDEVRDDIVLTLTARKAAESAEARGQALITSLQAGEAQDETSTIEKKTMPTTRKDAQTPEERQIVEQVFGAKIPTGESLLINGFQMSNGDYAVYELKSITPGDVANATEAERQAVTNQLISRDSNSAFGILQQGIRKHAKVELFSSLLNDETPTQY